MHARLCCRGAHTDASNPRYESDGLVWGSCISCSIASPVVFASVTCPRVLDIVSSPSLSSTLHKLPNGRASRFQEPREQW
eukprot:2802570-Amphidinium_carterae.1